VTHSLPQHDIHGRTPQRCIPCGGQPSFEPGWNQARREDGGDLGKEVLEPVHQHGTAHRGDERDHERNERWISLGDDDIASFEHFQKLEARGQVKTQVIQTPPEEPRTPARSRGYPVDRNSLDHLLRSKRGLGIFI